MKTIICFTILLLINNSISFSQGTIDYQAGTSLTIQPGADVCADDININGTFSGGGTICGSGTHVLNLTAFIEGFYNSISGNMRSDYVTVYLRNTTFPFAIVSSSQKILNPSGVGTYIFPNAVNGTNYYIVLRHRNSIETWSSTGIAFVSNYLAYNFTTAASKAYGNNQAQIDAAPVRFGIYSGDVNQDGVVDASDLSLIDNDAFNSVSGYVSTDLSGDDFVDGSDLLIADNNAGSNVIAITP